MATHAIPEPRGRTLLDCLINQGRVISALVLRELHTRYGRENIGYLWMVGEPLLLGTVIGIFHATGGHTAYGGDINPVAFGVLGYTTFILFRGIVNRSAGAFEANAPLLYHKQVTLLDVTIARAILEFGGVFTTSMTLMGLLILAGFTHPPDRPLAFFAAWGLMFWYSLGHSLLIAAITVDNRTIERLIHPYSYFMVGLGGAFIQLQWLPHPVRDVLTYVPLTSVFELLRYGWFRSCKPDYFFPIYLVGACFVLTWTGLVAMSVARRKLHLQ